MEPSLSAQYLSGLVDHLVLQGVNVDHFLAPFGVQRGDVADGQKRFPVTLYEQMLDAAATQLEDPHLGLHVGEGIKSGRYGVLGYVVMSCATLGDAMQRHARYENLVSGRGQVTYEALGEQVQLRWDSGEPAASRQQVEDNLASWVTIARWITGQSLAPTRVSVPYAVPTEQAHAEYERVFRCPVLWAQASVALTFPGHYLGLPIVSQDAEVLAMMEAYAERLLVNLSGNDKLQRAKALVAEHLASGEVTLSWLAQQLATSERQLQRKLSEEGVSYVQLLDDVRRDMAERYIRDDQLSLTDIAFLLGYADQSAFQKAFKRWFDATPGRYRQQATNRT
ncbi:AraC family transcriptional regulator [Salinispirillum sp. LH 10-3-1]|uniref:AraC family transcriptional regulator n=1 Tax=Salinispirillum sp. LH 10-3-1 TaxID=2952525 RepID=A0AB38YJI1_9GAMM